MAQKRKGGGKETGGLECLQHTHIPLSMSFSCSISCFPDQGLGGAVEMKVRKTKVVVCYPSAAWGDCLSWIHEAPDLDLDDLEVQSNEVPSFGRVQIYDTNIKISKVWMLQTQHCFASIGCFQKTKEIVLRQWGSLTVLLPHHHHCGQLASWVAKLSKCTDLQSTVYEQWFHIIRHFTENRDSLKFL